MKRIENYIKTLFLKIFLFFFRNKKKYGEIKSFEKVLLIRLNKIGDALVTTPFIDLFQKLYPNAIIDVLADKKNNFIFNNNSKINKVYIYQKGLTKIFKHIKLLNHNKYDIILDLHDDVSTTVTIIIALVKSDYKVALNKNTSPIYTNTIERIDPTRNHIIDRLIKIIELFEKDFNKNEINVKYNLDPEKIIIINDFIIKNKLVNNFLVGINISAGSSARNWEIDNYEKIIDFLLTFNLKIIILSNNTEKEFGVKLSKKSNNIFYLDTTNDFDKLASMLSKLNLLITPDTSLVHLASAYKIPLFGLYVQYNTDDVIWYPYSSEYEIIVTKEPTLKNMQLNEVKNKFKPFFESLYEKYFNSRL